MYTSSYRARVRLCGALLVACTACSCSDEVPTTVLLRIEQGSLKSAPSRLFLWVYGDAGRYVDQQRVPKAGAPELPGEVVLYPKQAPDRLRLRVEAKDGLNVLLGYGVTKVELVAGGQTGARIVLQQKPPADQDGDGVPDEIDNCPTLPNPNQDLCDRDGGAGGGDGPKPSDGGSDRGPDTVNCDEDDDGYRSEVCGGDDCNDKLKSVHPGADESGPGSTVCTDGIDNDCDKKTDTGEEGCRQCETANECIDLNECTKDDCVDAVCQNPPTISGQSCDDKIPCTQSFCQRGKCVTDTSTTYCQINGQCYRDGFKGSDGCVCDTLKSDSDWSLPPNGCKINGQCYGNNAKDPVSGCHCVPSVSTANWSPTSTQCFINGTCVNDGEGVVCQTCDPNVSQSSYTPIATCQKAIVLVGANGVYTGNLGGEKGADEKCRLSAAAVGLAIKPLAFIGTKSGRNATSIVPAGQRLLPVVNARGETIYSTWIAMQEGKASQVKSFYTFDGTKIDGKASAWTGMTSSGEYSSVDCNNWNSDSQIVKGRVHGLAVTPTPFNVLVANPYSSTCDTSRALLCVWIPPPKKLP
ncbi:MAG: hypothetical protein CSA24_02310 [Deltaproteobacteria bacterium]|nr:MAG: hypothetical protein CSB49_05500 [Pseudomonadota bacterium]PIE65630.1 MAG: hypothetical protein CSA24_02310 [Deltaproteobacteria bacterium]